MTRFAKLLFALALIGCTDGSDLGRAGNYLDDSDDPRPIEEPFAEETEEGEEGQGIFGCEETESQGGTACWRCYYEDGQTAFVECAQPGATCRTDEDCAGGEVCAYPDEIGTAGAGSDDASEGRCTAVAVQEPLPSEDGAE